VEDIIRTTHPSIVNTLDSQLKQPALYYAIVNNSDEISQELMKILIRNGANIKYKDQNQQTVLFYVCREGLSILIQGKRNVQRYSLVMGLIWMKLTSMGRRLFSMLLMKIGWEL
jgi:hypothetical protein